MSIAQWSDELTTGVREIDSQHKELIKMVNDLHDALLQGRGKHVIEDAINFLSNYVIEHFQMEEKLMTQHNYVGFAGHKREHESFIHDFSNLVQEYGNTDNSSYLAITLQKSIMQWLVNHIMKVDKQMASAIVSTAGDGKVA